MKTIARILFLFVFFSLGLVSCKKEYTCSCLQTYITTAYTQYGTFHPQSTTASEFKNAYKGKDEDAKSFCRSFERINIDTYGSGEAQRTATETVECELY